MKEIIESYMTLGALGLSYCILIAIIIKYVNSIAPILQQVMRLMTDMQKENINHKSVLDNNTKALETVAKGVEQVAQSNNNVANMVQLLKATIENQISTLERHDRLTGEKLQEIVLGIKDCSDLTQENIDDIQDVLKLHDIRGERIEQGITKLKSTVEKQTLELKSCINEKKL